VGKGTGMTIFLVVILVASRADPANVGELRETVRNFVCVVASRLADLSMS